jgi:ribosome recycling factor
MRNIRRDGIDGIKKLTGKGHSEDEIKNAQDEVQKLTDKEIAKAEQLAAQKEESIIKV